MLFTQIKIKNSSPMKFNDRMESNQLIFLFRKKTLLFIEIIQMSTDKFPLVLLTLIQVFYETGLAVIWLIKLSGVNTRN